MSAEFNKAEAVRRAQNFLEIRTKMYSPDISTPSPKTFRSILSHNLDSAPFLSTYMRDQILFRDKHYFKFAPLCPSKVAEIVSVEFGVDLSKGKLGIHGDIKDAVLAERNYFNKYLQDMKHLVIYGSRLSDQVSWEQWEAYLEDTERLVCPALKFLDEL